MKYFFRSIAIPAAIEALARTQQVWHEGVKQGQRQERYQALPGTREECLRALEEGNDYEYRRELEKLLKAEITETE